jgi:hypothetical protein
MKQAVQHIPSSERATLGAAFAKAKAESLQSARGTGPREPQHMKDVLREHCLGFVRAVNDQRNLPRKDCEGADWSSFHDYLNSAVHAKFS